MRDRERERERMRERERREGEDGRDSACGKDTSKEKKILRKAT